MIPRYTFVRASYLYLSSQSSYSYVLCFFITGSRQ